MYVTVVSVSVSGVALCQRTAETAGCLAKWALIIATIGLVVGIVGFIFLVWLYNNYYD